MNQLLLIEDEQHVADVIKKGLEEDGYMVDHVADGLIGLDLIDKKSFQLIILDILLPHINGLEICKKIKSELKLDVPVLMLTALGSAENVVLGLDSGADDYLAKPFKLIELKARVRNLLRRNDFKPKQNYSENNVLIFADIEMNDESKTVKRAGNELSLTSTEYKLLNMFLKKPNKVFSRSELLDEVWGIDYDIGTNVVDVYVNYLRKKLDKFGSEKLIHTVIGMGYILKSE